MFNPYSKELLCGAKKVNIPKFGNDIWKMMQHENRGDFMYESPITNYISEIYDKQMVERENFILATVSEKIGIDINREELIKALNYDRQQYEKGYADAKAEYAPKWVKVEDRLPEDGERVLIYADTEDGYEIAERHFVEFRVDEYEWEVFSTLGYKYALDDEEVIAWMPIPKYEAERSEKE